MMGGMLTCAACTAGPAVVRLQFCTLMGALWIMQNVSLPVNVSLPDIVIAHLLIALVCLPGSVDCYGLQLFLLLCTLRLTCLCFQKSACMGCCTHFYALIVHGLRC